MKKRIISVASSVLICAAGAADGQSQSPNMQLHSARMAPLTPQDKALYAEKGRQLQSAAAALDAGHYAEAEADARQSMTWGGDSGIGQEILASALNAQGKTEEALQAYQVIADRGSDQPRNLLPYALLLLKTGHYAHAVAAYNKQLPYLAEGDLMSANSHFSPTVPQPRQLATAIHIALGLTYGSSATWGRHSQDDKALAEFQQALTLTPDSALAHLYYGHHLKHMGHRAEAQEAFAKAAELAPDAQVKAAAETALRQRSRSPLPLPKRTP